LIRTAGGKANSNELGFGHIFRSLNLADQFKHQKIYFLIEDYGGVKKISVERGYTKIFSLKKDLPLKQQLVRTNSLLKKEKIDLIIIDRYKVKKSYVKQISKNVKTVVISDLYKLDFEANLLVNGFIGYKNKIFKNKYGTRCLVGPDFQIVDQKFSKRGKNVGGNFNILATFGGSDKKNIMKIFVKCLKKNICRLNVKLILGYVNKKNSNLLLLEKKHSRNLKIIKKTHDMHKEMLKCNFGFCSGGITCYEFAAMGIPFAIISQVKHQLISANEWQKKGLAINLGIPSKKLEKKLKKMLDNLAEGKKIIKGNYAIVDGKGSMRVTREALKLLEK